MKFLFLVLFIVMFFTLSGCQTMREHPDYIGELPYYANNTYYESSEGN